jgi:ribose 5-phosphate isomerase RpiB
VVGDKLARKLALKWLDYKFDHQFTSAKKVKAIEEYKAKKKSAVV